MRDASLLTMADMSSTQHAAGSPLVLVVDDQAEVRRLIHRMLEHSGFEVAEAANGEEALGLLDAGVSPRVIVLDLWMPIIDGWEFLERTTTRAPVIVISGVEEETHPLPASVVRFLKKPIGREELLAALQEAGRRAHE
jgi:CheY-like chemotaxis protein